MIVSGSSAKVGIEAPGSAPGEVELGVGTRPAVVQVMPIQVVAATPLNPGGTPGGTPGVGMMPSGMPGAGQPVAPTGGANFAALQTAAGTGAMPDAGAGLAPSTELTMAFEAQQERSRKSQESQEKVIAGCWQGATTCMSFFFQIMIPIVVLFLFWQVFAVPRAINCLNLENQGTAYSGTRTTGVAERRRTSSSRSSSRSGTRSVRQLEEVVDKESERGATLEEWFDDDEEAKSRKLYHYSTTYYTSSTGYYYSTFYSGGDDDPNDDADDDPCSTTYGSPISPGCVTGNNIVLYSDKTVDECKALCNAEPTCLAFEYGVDHGGLSTLYDPGDCHLQSSADESGCDGAYYNLDLYKKISCANESVEVSPEKYYTPPEGCTCTAATRWDGYTMPDECAASPTSGDVICYVLPDSNCIDSQYSAYTYGEYDYIECERTGCPYVLNPLYIGWPFYFLYFLWSITYSEPAKYILWSKCVDPEGMQKYLDTMKEARMEVTMHVRCRCVVNPFRSLEPVRLVYSLLVLTY